MYTPRQNVLKALKKFLKDTHSFEDKDSVQFFREKEGNRINFFIHNSKEFDQDMLVIKSLYTLPTPLEEAAREISENYGLSYIMLMVQDDA